MSPGFLGQLETDLVAAAERRAAAVPDHLTRTTRPRSRRPLVAAVALFVFVAALAGTATALLVRDSRIPAPNAIDAGPAGVPVPGSSRLTPVRAADPAGGLPWGLRLARTRDGLVCATVGQLRGATLGIAGLDGRFRTVDEGAVDGCGRVRPPRAVLIGARVFDAARRGDVRTVVYGVAGRDLRGVTLAAGDSSRAIAVGAGGVFIATVRGYPEDLGLDVSLRFAGGKRRSFPFGTNRFVVQDPLGGPAWQVNGFSISDFPQQCVSFTWARDRDDAPTAPPACGRGPARKHMRGYWFAVRRVGPTRGKPAPFAGGWPRDVPSRTAVWGSAGEDVERIVVTGAGAPRTARLTTGGTFLVMFAPRVDPSRLRVRVVKTDGATIVRRGDANLVAPPKAGP